MFLMKMNRKQYFLMPIKLLILRIIDHSSFRILCCLPYQNHLYTSKTYISLHKIFSAVEIHFNFLKKLIFGVIIVVII